MNLARVALLAPLLALSGCVAGATDGQLRDRAAFDLHCDKSQIKVIQLDTRMRGVTACGQQVTYVESCTNRKDIEIGTKSSNCTWVLNADSKQGAREQGAAASPLPATCMKSLFQQL